jgi:hypothetical protein
MYPPRGAAMNPNNILLLATKLARVILICLTSCKYRTMNVVIIDPAIILSPEKTRNMTRLEVNRELRSIASVLTGTSSSEAYASFGFLMKNVVAIPRIMGHAKRK